MKRAQGLGAKVLAAPFDVTDSGRVAVLQDPVGAIFSVWQPKRHIGVGILREPGALCWTELITRDTSAAEKFYTQLFGWTAKRGTDGGMEYTELSNGRTAQAGLLALTPQMGNMPPMSSNGQLKHEGGGVYVGTIQVLMAWTWETTVTAKKNGQVIGSAKTTITAR